MAQRRLSIVLVEVPAVGIEMKGESLLDDFTLSHPKYSQLVLLANLKRIADVDLNASLIDLKGGSEPATVPYGEIDYCGQRLELLRTGVPLEREQERLLNADIVGISANFTFERSMVIQTIRYIKEQGSRSLIVIGGHDATADPEYYLRRGADLCVLGEGETAIQEIVRAVANGDSACVDGTASLQNGKLRKDRRRPVHSLAEIVFPDLHLLRTTNFRESPDGPLPAGVSPPIMSLETSRGCPEACSFCDISFIVGGFRPVPFDVVVEKVRTLKAAGMRTIQVLDDNLLYRMLPAYESRRGRQEIIDLFDLLYDEGFAWEFFNGFQLGLFENDGVIDTELIGALYRNGYDRDRFVGCFRSYMPLDKVTEPEMSLLRKLKPLEIGEAVVSAIAEQRVPGLALGFVIGSVRETPQSLAETVTRAERFKEIVVQSSGGRTVPAVLFLCSVPLPGTPDFRSFHDNIAFPDDEYPELYNIFMSVLRNEHFSPLDLTQQRRLMRDRLNCGGGFEVQTLASSTQLA